MEEQHRLAHIVVVDRHASGCDGLAGARLGEAIRGDEGRLFLLLAVYETPWPRGGRL
jgi:hypothetical protein